MISQSHIMYQPNTGSGQGYSTQVQPIIQSTEQKLKDKADKSEVDLLKEKNIIIGGPYLKFNIYNWLHITGKFW